MQQFISWISATGDKVFTEAGILAFILFLMCVYLIWDNRSLRKEKDALAEKASAKIYALGTEQVKSSIESNHVLDKMGDVLHNLTRVLERAGILERKTNDKAVEKVDRT